MSKLSLLPPIDNTYFSTAGKPGWPKDRADWTTRWFAEDRCLDASSKRGFCSMAHSEYWETDHIVYILGVILGGLHGCILYLNWPRGKFTLSRYLRLVIIYATGAWFGGDAYRFGKYTALQGSLVEICTYLILTLFSLFEISGPTWSSFRSWRGLRWLISVMVLKTLALWSTLWCKKPPRTTLQYYQVTHFRRTPFTITFGLFNHALL